MLYGEARLANVDADLVRLVESIAADEDIIVVQGARTVAEEKAAIASGHSRLQNPLNSKHVTYIDRPLALAVDLAPYPIDWTNTAAFQGLGAAVKARAAALGVPLAWGGDWAHLKDYDHFEKAEQHG